MDSFESSHTKYNNFQQASSVMKRHAQKCVWKHPPGDEIYRKDKLSVFEVTIAPSCIIVYHIVSALRCVVRSTSNTARTFA